MDGRELTDRKWSGDVETEPSGSLRAEISDALVGLKKRFYGKGPTAARTYFNDQWVFCILDGGFTRNEETLIAAGEEALVRQYRLRFEEVMTETATDAVQRITQRRVLGYHSQVMFDPPHAIEIFVLDRPPGRVSDDTRPAARNS